MVRSATPGPSRPRPRGPLDGSFVSGAAGRGYFRADRPRNRVGGCPARCLVLRGSGAGTARTGPRTPLSIGPPSTLSLTPDGLRTDGDRVIKQSRVRVRLGFVPAVSRRRCEPGCGNSWSSGRPRRRPGRRTPLSARTARTWVSRQGLLIDVITAPRVGPRGLGSTGPSDGGWRIARWGAFSGPFSPIGCDRPVSGEFSSEWGTPVLQDLRSDARRPDPAGHRRRLPRTCLWRFRAARSIRRFRRRREAGEAPTTWPQVGSLSSPAAPRYCPRVDRGVSWPTTLNRVESSRAWA